MSGGIPYIGSRISLISRSDIRYEGRLHSIDTKESTVALQNVRSFGTEGRKTGSQIAPSNEVYDYIIFRGADIKDLTVCEPPQPSLHQRPPNDPAIVHAPSVFGYPYLPHYGPQPGMNPYHQYWPPYYGYPHMHPPPSQMMPNSGGDWNSQHSQPAPPLAGPAAASNTTSAPSGNVTSPPGMNLPNVAPGQSPHMAPNLSPNPPNVDKDPVSKEDTSKVQNVERTPPNPSSLSEMPNPSNSELSTNNSVNDDLHPDSDSHSDLFSTSEIDFNTEDNQSLGSEFLNDVDEQTLSETNEPVNLSSVQKKKSAHELVDDNNDKRNNDVASNTLKERSGDNNKSNNRKNETQQNRNYKPNNKNDTQLQQIDRIGSQLADISLKQGSASETSKPRDQGKYSSPKHSTGSRKEGNRPHNHNNVHKQPHRNQGNHNKSNTGPYNKNMAYGSPSNKNFRGGRGGSVIRGGPGFRGSRSGNMQRFNGPPGRGGFRPNNRVGAPRSGAKQAWTNDFDFASNLEKFDKEEFEQEQEKLRKERENPDSNEELLIPETPYDKTVSFYDNISCETQEKLDRQKEGRKEKGYWNEQRKREQEKDAETFGIPLNVPRSINHSGKRPYPPLGPNSGGFRYGARQPNQSPSGQKPRYNGGRQ
eukprot:TRINITY_DN313_c0_g1_i4.p1 TRINITY_DN313_c0_g1~~TRINITY_DN313_c0_g1_i4.p1  ORF type:complete len:644 (-),score=136.33 TRINITY_DN313_c0_g1_i4:86-2017(-)